MKDAVKAVDTSSISRQRKLNKKILTYLILIGGAIVVLLPFVWMLSTSLKGNNEVFVFPPKWIPDPIHWSNYPTALTFVPFGKFAFNTAVITFWGMLGEVFTGALVAYGFAKFRFKGRDVLFIILLATMMLPGEVTMIPVFIMFKELGWIDTFYPLTVPAYFGGSPFFIFLLRQFFLAIPNEMEDAARMDGCNSFQIFYKIMLPLAKPALAVVAIFSFQGKWNDFFGPLIYLNSKENFTLQLGLAFFQGMFKTEWALLMAASVVVLLPVLIVFFMFQKYFIEGINLTGIKG